jgi:predicted PurR-regulated permease PerM
MSVGRLLDMLPIAGTALVLVIAVVGAWIQAGFWWREGASR